MLQAGNASFAVLLSGDTDRIPPVAEVRRHGVTVIVSATQQGLASDLREAADEVWLLDAKLLSG